MKEWYCVRSVTSEGWCTKHSFVVSVQKNNLYMPPFGVSRVLHKRVVVFISFILDIILQALIKWVSLFSIMTCLVLSLFPSLFNICFFFYSISYNSHIFIAQEQYFYYFFTVWVTPISKPNKHSFIISCRNRIMTIHNHMTIHIYTVYWKFH